MPDCHFLMHMGDSAYEGHPMAVKAAADFEQRACKRMLEIFSKRAFASGPHWKKRKTYTEKSAYNYFEKKINILQEVKVILKIADRDHRRKLFGIEARRS